MSQLRKRLDPHAVTCIKKALVECARTNPNHGLAYEIYCDREDCWDQCELISNYFSAVNIREVGDNIGESYNGTKKHKAQLALEVQIYNVGCDDIDECQSPADVAMSVLADIQQYLCNKDPKEFLSERITYQGFSRRQFDGASKQIVEIVGRFTIGYAFDNCSTNTVFHSGATPNKTQTATGGERRLKNPNNKWWKINGRS